MPRSRTASTSGLVRGTALPITTRSMSAGICCGSKPSRTGMPSSSSKGAHRWVELCVDTFHAVTHLVQQPGEGGHGRSANGQEVEVSGRLVTILQKESSTACGPLYGLIGLSPDDERMTRRNSSMNTIPSFEADSGRNAVFGGRCDDRAAHAEGPKMVVPEKVKDVGTVAQGEMVEVDFSLINEGTDVSPGEGRTPHLWLYRGGLRQGDRCRWRGYGEGQARHQRFFGSDFQVDLDHDQRSPRAHRIGGHQGRCASVRRGAAAAVDPVQRGPERGHDREGRGRGNRSRPRASRSPE